MRAPFQILAIPCKKMDDRLYYCVFHRADVDQWQFIAGGGEDAETPEEAALREIYEESSVSAKELIRLRSLCHIPANVIAQKDREHWPADTWVIPEYAFGFECREGIVLSREHLGYAWLTYEEAKARLQWDSNRTALYELDCRLKNAP